ncbi:MAG: 4Fe-4S dicluster domain-containing protein [Desulfobacterota bacterium]|nr:4Fe-4S dicluster domain-containing protein [Thermodesulfobacteriota bacterium]MDW8001408.1 4Fe-4S dicluster domain-containing protein [Deltaproteobacteria bacterium]
MKVEEKLAKNIVKIDRESHIEIKGEICSNCEKKYCLIVCPGNLYKYNEETNEVTVEHSGCLECGTCMIACVKGAILWRYPRGEYGVQYRYG